MTQMVGAHGLDYSEIDVTDWYHKGPVLAGGDVLALHSVSRSKSLGSVWAGTVVGLHRSLDGGTTWNLASEQVAGFPVTAIAVAPSYSVERSIFVGGAPGSVMYSLDDGVTWEARLLEYSGITVTTLVISPSFDEDGTILAGTLQDGLYRSSTRGRFWKPANFGLYDLAIWDVAISPNWRLDQTAFVIAGNHLFRTANGARAWKQVAPELEELAPQTIVISPAFESDGTVFLGTLQHGIWKSLDAGDTWSQVGDTEGVIVNCFACSATYEQDGMLFAGTAKHGILWTRDGGETWNPLGIHLPTAIISLVETVCDDSRVLLAGVEGQGVLRLKVGDDNGQEASESRHWTWSSHGMAARPVTSLVVTRDSSFGSLLYVGGNSGLLVRSEDAGANWRHVASEILQRADIYCLAVHANKAIDGLILVGSTDGIFRSVDKGVTWSKATLENGVESVSDITFSPTFAQDQCAWGCSSDGHLLRSLDAGRDWQVVQVPFEHQRSIFVSISPDYAADRTLFVATAAASETGGALLRLWQSENAGRNWTKLWEQEHGPARELLLAMLHSERRSYQGRGALFMASGSDIFCPSSSNQQTWVSRSLPDGAAIVLAFLVVEREHGPRAFVVGTNRGLFLSWDDCRSWQQPVGGPDRLPIVDLAISSDPVGVRGIWVLAVGGDLWYLSINERDL